MAFVATSSFGHARVLAEKKDGRVLQQFALEADTVNSSEMLVSVYAVGILLLSVGSLVAMWVPPRKEEEPNSAPEPTPTIGGPPAAYSTARAVPLRAGAPVALARGRGWF
jgi:hypothetical protein